MNRDTQEENSGCGRGLVRREAEACGRRGLADEADANRNTKRYTAVVWAAVGVHGM